VPRVEQPWVCFLLMFILALSIDLREWGCYSCPQKMTTAARSSTGLICSLVHSMHTIILVSQGQRNLDVRSFLVWTKRADFWTFEITPLYVYLPSFSYFPHLSSHTLVHGICGQLNQQYVSLTKRIRRWNFHRRVRAISRTSSHSAEN
jgi:hypothetical protein